MLENSVDGCVSFPGNHDEEERLAQEGARFEQDEQYSDAIRIYKLLLATKERHSSEIRELLPVVHSLGLLHRKSGDFEGAEAYYQRALLIARVAFPNDEALIARHQNFLAGLLYAQKKYALSRALIQSSCQIYERHFGLNHQYTIFSYLTLSLVHEREQNRNDASHYCHMASRSLFSHPEFGVTPNEHITRNLALCVNMYLKQDKFDEAEVLLRHLLMREAAEDWPHDPLVADNLHLLAGLLCAQGMSKEAEVLYLHAFEIRSQTLSAQDPLIATTAQALANLYCRLHRYSDAERYFQVALNIRNGRAETNAEELTQTIYNFSALLRRIGKLAEAQQLECRIAPLRKLRQAQRPPAH